MGLFLLGEGCSRSEQRKADEQMSEVRAEAQRLGQKTKAQADKMAHELKTNGTAEAEAKLSHGEQDLERAGGKAAAKLDHAALIAKIKASLADKVGLNTLKTVDIEAEGGVVVLHGNVSSAEQKLEIERVTANTDGVAKVDDQLQIQP